MFKQVVFVVFLLSSILFSAEGKVYILKFKTFDKEKIDIYKSSYSLKKYFSLSNEKLLDLKNSGEKKIKGSLSDLRNYFKTELTNEEFNSLKNDKFIDVIYPMPKMEKPPIAIDIAPTTPNLTSHQGYLYDFRSKGGVNATYGWNFRGGSGAGVTVVDIEYGWILDHEDLGIEESAILYKGSQNVTGTTSFETDGNHGAGVLGIMVAQKNSYGVTGICYDANIKIVSNRPKEFSSGAADAIARTIDAVDVGSIILLEDQTGGPNRTDTSNGQDGLVPVEWAQAEFDIIKTATANGYIIIEAAGNGDEDLDTNAYHTCSGDTNTYFSNHRGTEPCFNSSTRDSGAIIVGAGMPYANSGGEFRSKTGFSTGGSRVDVQAWGWDIASTSGDGNLFTDTEDKRQQYTSYFSGTSGASPIITGIVTQLQARYKVKNNGATLTAFQIRDILKDPHNSHPQVGNDTHIGPLPDTKLIFENFLGDSTSCNSRCKDWEDCKNKRCKLRKNRCNSKNDCSSNRPNCLNHTCKVQCGNSVCSDNEQCVNQVCKTKCGSSVCSDSQVCSNNRCKKKPKGKGNKKHCSYSSNSSFSIFPVLFLLMLLSFRYRSKKK